MSLDVVIRVTQRPKSAERTSRRHCHVRWTAQAYAPFPGGTIPESRVDPRSKKLLSFIPEPNVQSTSFNFLSNILNTFDVNRGAARVDHKPSGVDSLRDALRPVGGEIVV